MPLYRKDLDAALAKGCQIPGCECAHEPLTELWVHQKCHPSAGIEACYRDGVLYAFCHACRKPIASIAVAEKPGSPIATLRF